MERTETCWSMGIYTPFDQKGIPLLKNVHLIVEYVAVAKWDPSWTISSGWISWDDHLWNYSVYFLDVISYNILLGDFFVPLCPWVQDNIPFLFFRYSLLQFFLETFPLCETKLHLLLSNNHDVFCHAVNCAICFGTRVCLLWSIAFVCVLWCCSLA